MAAFVEHSFRGGFLLDETRLRKLKDIIESRETRASESKIVYRVSRGDSYAYETQSVDEVVGEDNEDWRRITRLDLKISPPGSGEPKRDDLRFLLSFSDKEGCELRIAADERDRVFLLFSDLRDYIQNEVTVTRRIDRDTARFTAMAASLAFIMLVGVGLVYAVSHVEPDRVRQALDSPDITKKLNFIIEERVRPPRWWALILATAAFVIAIISPLSGGIARLVFPGNEFLFGKRKERFERRQRLTSNLLWVVGVGCVVSIAAGLIVWKFTNSH